uniref:ARAD1D35310p n=1 Tax=Blastobotrys adeninivorans TaxID=409370 RepID=A0A060TH18_BLAAD
MQGYNRYYPPDYDGKRSLNQLAGKSHALGKRARRLSEGILVVRFEAPFDFYCQSCNTRIGQGTRFNADKSENGAYYSTKIWRFTFKCYQCKSEIAIETDPQNTRYVVVSGGREAASNSLQQHDIRIKEPQDQLDPFDKAEKQKAAEVKKMHDDKVLTSIYLANQRQWDDPFERSQALRKNFREESKRIEAKRAEEKAIQDKNSLSIPIVDEAADDQVVSQNTSFEKRALQKVSDAVARASSMTGFNGASAPASTSAVSNALLRSRSSFEIRPTKRPKKQKQKLIDYDSD